MRIGRLPSDQTAFMIPGRVGNLEAILAKSQSSPKALAVICHPHPLHGGTLQNKVVTVLHKAFQHLSMYTLRFNYRGVGKSQGHFGEGIGETDDALAIVDWARQYYPELPLIFSGFSFGCYVTLSATLKSPVQPMLLVHIAPVVTSHDFITPGYSVKYPWLVVVGDQDELISMESINTWKARQSQVSDLVVLENSTHFFHGKLTQLNGIVQKKTCILCPQLRLEAS